MKIAVLTSGILPVPAVQGGAVENLVDFYLDYNNTHRLHDITVYSIRNDAAMLHDALSSDVNRYRFIRTDGLIHKVGKRLVHCFCRNDYYHPTIGYYLWQAMNDMRHHRYDMVIIENRPGYALSLSRCTQARIVLHLHNDLLNDTTRMGREIYDALDGTVCVSDHIAARVRTVGADAGKTVTVYNGIDTGAFSPTRPRGMTRAGLGLSESDFLLIFSGRINREKGISELVDAMITLNRHERIKLMIIGSPFYGNVDNEDAFVRQLKTKAARVSDRITFTGFIPYDRMPEYLCLADAAVIPSVWDDPFPTTVLEAQAMGLPVITTDRGGIPEEVCRDNAVIIPPGAGFAERLADAILSLCNDTERCRSMAEASLLRSQMFTKETYAKNFFNAIELYRHRD